MNIHIPFFPWLGPVPTHDSDFGTGPWVKKCLLEGVWNRPSSTNPRESEKCVGEKGRFRTFLGGPWLTASCQNRSPCFDHFPNDSYHFLYLSTLLSPCFNLLCSPCLFRFLVFSVLQCGKVTVTLLIVFRTQKCKCNSNQCFPGHSSVSVFVFAIISRTRMCECNHLLCVREGGGPRECQDLASFMC